MRPKEERQARGWSAAELGGSGPGALLAERTPLRAGVDSFSPSTGTFKAPGPRAVPPAPAPGPEPTVAAAPSFHDTWVSALTAAEVDVDEAEDLLRRLHAGEDVDPVVPGPAWPGGRGPIPVEFAERARLLLRRQLRVSEELTAALLHTRAELNALKKLDPAEQRPIFFDQAL